MDINIEYLIKELEIYKEKVQENLTEEEDLMFAVVLAVLETIKKEEND